MALLLSAIPGAGHCFKGYWIEGALIFFIGTPLVLLLAIGFTMFFFGWLFIPLFWGGIAADAYFRKDLHIPVASAPHH